MEIYYKRSTNTVIVQGMVTIKGDEAWVPVKGGYNVYEYEEADVNRVVVTKWLGFRRGS